MKGKPADELAVLFSTVEKSPWCQYCNVLVGHGLQVPRQIGSLWRMETDGRWTLSPEFSVVLPELYLARYQLGWPDLARAQFDVARAIRHDGLERFLHGPPPHPRLGEPVEFKEDSE